MAKSVFYSFHYEQDVHRVQLVRNINALEGQPLLNSQDWEQVRRRGDQAIKNWIHDQMAYKKAVIVLIGKHTASRPWVIYEIEKAWADKRPLLGIRIHGLSSLGSVDSAGSDPFAKADGVGSVPIFDPTTRDWHGKIDSRATYNKLRDNLETWSSQGVTRRSW
ncbi:TIR domain-containing protein [Streptomyces purpureus]|uniref:TIR domain-containing protein n=1 Tax=Streptomyces purpureus TaxID=1951 RepID=UPI0003818901|nr:TIR domain-containing protein [Streptomyces purpureus]